MIDRPWPRLPCCCAALLSWDATTRRAQQRSHRRNFGELDKLHFVKKEISQERSFWVSGFRRACVCARRRDYFISLSFSVSPGSWQGFFGAVDERVWGALLVKTRESSLGLRFPPLLCQSDQNENPVSFRPLKITLQVDLSEVRIEDNRGSIRGSGRHELRFNTFSLM